QGKAKQLEPFLLRVAFMIGVAVAGYHFQPFGLSRFPSPVAGFAGLLLGALIVVFEVRLRIVSLKRLIGAIIGGILGILGAYLFSLVIKNSIDNEGTQRFLQLVVVLLMSYIGLIVGANKSDLLNLAALGGIFGAEKQEHKSFTILDSSVIIDGR